MLCEESLADTKEIEPLQYVEGLLGTLDEDDPIFDAQGEA